MKHSMANSNCPAFHNLSVCCCSSLRKVPHITFREVVEGRYTPPTLYFEGTLTVCTECGTLHVRKDEHWEVLKDYIEGTKCESCFPP